MWFYTVCCYRISFFFFFGETYVILSTFIQEHQLKCMLIRKQKISDLMIFFFFFLPILWWIVIVYLKMIIDFLSFLFTFPWQPYGPGHKQITKVWKSIFSTVLVMSEHCPNSKMRLWEGASLYKFSITETC